MLVQVSSSVTSNVFSEHASWLMNRLHIYIVGESLKDASRKGSVKGVPLLGSLTPDI